MFLIPASEIWFWFLSSKTFYIFGFSTNRDKRGRHFSHFLTVYRPDDESVNQSIEHIEQIIFGCSGGGEYSDALLYDAGGAGVLADRRSCY